MIASDDCVASRFQHLAEERYKDGSSSSINFPAELPQTLETILNHRSTRFFRPDGLPAGTLEALVLAGQSASSSSLLQTWDVVAIQDPAHKDAAAKLAGDQDFIREAPLLLVFVANLRRLTNISENYDQPGKALSTMDLFIMGALDAAIAGQNAALAAQSLGLGTCYVGAVRNNAQQMIELLGLPPRTFGVFGLAVGYPNTVKREEIKPRLPMREVLHRETWDEKEQDANVESFNRVLGRFYYEHLKLGRDPWSEFVAKKLAVTDLDGRERTREVLDGQNLPLV